jgi:hypothetical protein
MVSRRILNTMSHAVMDQPRGETKALIVYESFHNL